MALRSYWANGLAALALCLVTGHGRAAPPMDRGEYIYRLSGCENCHTDRDHAGARLAGGRRLATPLGVFVTPNITPDRETGLGTWREKDFRHALRRGISPHGEHYYPSFPYTSYTRLSDDDIHALWQYLRKVPAAYRANSPHELPWYLRFRPLLAVWKWLFFDAGPFQAEREKTPAWNQGAYLVQGAGHCAECHTPRNRLGGFRADFALAGTTAGPEGRTVPNITPDPETGIGKWKVPELAQYLQSGMRPDGDSAGGLMAEVIDNGLKYLSPEDLNAIAVYVLDQRPVRNPVKSNKKAGKKPASEDY